MGDWRIEEGRNRVFLFVSREDSAWGSGHISTLVQVFWYNLFLCGPSS
jgi:hypothetical protein